MDYIKIGYSSPSLVWRRSTKGCAGVAEFLEKKYIEQIKIYFITQNTYINIYHPLFFFSLQHVECSSDLQCFIKKRLNLNPFNSDLMNGCPADLVFGSQDYDPLSPISSKCRVSPRAAAFCVCASPCYFT